MRPTIVGLGRWVPEESRTNDMWPPEFIKTYGGTRTELTEIAVDPNGDAIDRLVSAYASPEADDPFFGTVRRRIASSKTTAHEAETAAAIAAIADAGVSAADIDVVISVPALPDRLAPTPAAAVAHAVGATRAHAFGIEWPCASSITSLELASALIESKRARLVLPTQSHLMTRAHPFMHPASPNLGDAATAVVIAARETGSVVSATRLVTHGEFFDAVTWRRRRGEDAPWWEPGGAIALGSYAPDQARQLVKDTVRIGAQTVRELLDRACMSPDQVDVFTSVQPRRWIPRAIAEASGMLRADVIETFSDFAHLGACGPFMNLLEARDRGILRRGARVVLYAQGAGFTRAAALVEW